MHSGLKPALTYGREAKFLSAAFLAPTANSGRDLASGRFRIAVICNSH